MKRQLSLSVLFALLSLSLYAQRTQELFDASWRFSKNDVSGGESVNLNDVAWRAVELPHDWSIEGNIRPKNPTGAAGGYFNRYRG